MNRLSQAEHSQPARLVTTLLVLVLSLLALPSNAAKGAGPVDEGGNADKSEPISAPQMTNQKLGVFLLAIDPNLAGTAGNWQLKVRELPVYVITDENADRMRIMIPVASATDVDRDELYRIMQANFESALDARYAIADKFIWSAFIHPLSPLDGDQLASALAQTYNAAATFGEEYSSGLFSFGGGDNARDVFDEILEKGLSL